MPWAAAAAAVGSVAAAGIGAAGSSAGASAASGASRTSAADQLAEFQLNYNTQNPFITGGYSGLNALQGGLASGQLGNPMSLAGQPTAGQVGGVPQYSWDPNSAGGAPSTWQVPQFQWNPTQAGLEATPGYQFTLNQGLESVQNSFANRGLGVSGAAMKGATQYATGLANSTYNQQLQNALQTNQQQLAGFNTGMNMYNTQFQNNLGAYNAQLAGYGQGLQGLNTAGSLYQNQFNDYWANQNNRYSNLYQLANLGQSTSVAQGAQGVNAMQGVGNALSTAGQYQGAGMAGVGNALSGGINTAMNSPYVQNMLTGGGPLGANTSYVDQGSWTG